MILRRRRDRGEPSGAPEEGGTGVAPEGPQEPAEGEAGRFGPWDAADIDHAADPGYIDLGGLLVKGRPGLELRLSSDSESGQIVAVMLAGPEGAVELRAFAAPRSTGIWDDVRAGIAEEASRMGGNVQEQKGEFGPELALVLPVKLEDGRQAAQPSRVVGVQGPRWLLRGTFLGKPAVQPEPDGVLEAAFRDVVVVRGDAPMSPREALPLRLPTDAQPWQAPPD